VSTRQRVWNVQTGEEVPNLYVMDSSMFPTSVGANPMQSLYTFARIFSERFIAGMSPPSPEPMEAGVMCEVGVAPEPRLLRPEPPPPEGS